MKLYRILFAAALVLGAVTRTRGDETPNIVAPNRAEKPDATKLKRDGPNPPQRRASNLPAVGFWDEGFRIGTVRTDFDAVDEGTRANPLTVLPCLYPPGSDPLLIPAGPTWNKSEGPWSRGPTVFDERSNNRYTNAKNWPMTRYWVLSVNNEPAFDARRNSGPPNQSMPVVKPGEGIMGLAAERATSSDPAGCRVRILVDPRHANPHQAGIPFLGIGAATDRGNGVPISYLNPSSAEHGRRIAFSLKLDTVHVGAVPGNAVSIWFYAFALWDGKPRMAMVSLYGSGRYGDGRPFRHRTGDKRFAHGHWNWNVRESFFYPGADIVYVDAADLIAEGLPLPKLDRAGQEADYVIDLQQLFTIASRSEHGVHFDSPLPSDADLPVFGVHWAVEVSGSQSYLGCSLRHMRTVP